jgi:hypothetical protein
MIECNRRPPAMAAVVFVELPSANRKTAASSRRFFLVCRRKKGGRESSFSSFRGLASAQDAQGVEHPEGEQTDHKNAGHHHIRSACRCFRGHEFPVSFQSCHQAWRAVDIARR